MKQLFTMIVMFLALAGLSSCVTGGSASQIDGQNPPEFGTSLTLTGTIPENGAVTVSIHTDVRVAFNAALDLASIHDQSIQVATEAGETIAGVVSYSADLDLLIFTAQAPLAYNTHYIARVASDLKDTSGNSPDGEMVFAFTTEVEPSPIEPPTPPPPISPAVIAVSPLDAAIDVAPDAVVRVVFSKPMKVASFTAATFQLLQGGLPVAGTITYDNAVQTASFTSASALAELTSFTVFVSRQVFDEDLLHPEADFTSTFTVREAPQPPAVIAISPKDGETGVSENAVVSAVFSKPMEAASITAATFQLLQAGVPVSGSISYDGPSQTARITPDLPLASLTNYSVLVSHDVLDKDALHPAADFTSSFTIRDDIPPTILSVVPADGAVGVAINASIEVQFDEPMDAASITPATFTLAQGAIPVAGTVSYQASSNTAAFTPFAPLASFTAYTAHIDGAVTDSAGNPLGIGSTWGFTTSDVTAPSVTGTDPSDGATGVERTALIHATFDKAMNAATINASTFTVSSPSGSISGSVSYDGGSLTATFTPDASLAGSTHYTAALNTGIHDSTGNALASTVSFGFTTKSATVITSAAGLYHSAAVLADGTVWTWGRNHFGQLGDGTRTDRAAPVRVPGLTGIIAVAAGEFHTVALKNDGTVWCWGRNNYGQLGDGTTANRLSPVQTQGPGGAIVIASGLHHSLLLRSDGSVWSWGRNNAGQLGDGTTTTAYAPQPVIGLGSATSIAAGQYFSLAILADATAWGWGTNTNGQLGDGSTTNRTTPVQASGLAGVLAIAGGGAHTIARLSDNSAWAWGLNANGQLGDGTATQRTTPVQVHGIGNVGFIANAAAVAAGGNFTLVARSDGSVLAFGLNSNGQLGDGTLTQRTSPVLIAAAGNAAAVVAGGFHSLAVHSDATMAGWGYNYYGQVGNNGATFVNYAPRQVAGLGTIVSVAGGLNHAVVAANNGTAWAWGINANGQVGDNTTVAKPAPVQVHGVGNVGMLSNVASVSGGGAYSVARKGDGTVFAWGLNSNNQLGDNTATQRLTPVQVHGIGNVGMLSNVTEVSSGYYHNLAILGDTTMVAWGRNANGQLGDGTTTARATPVAVPGLAGVVAVAAGTAHSLALLSDGSVWAWGSNASGQLGNATTTQSISPVQVHGPANVGMLSSIVAIDAGNNHSIAVAGDGSVYAWGSNGFGQLGDNTNTNRTTPVKVRGVNNAGFLSGIAAVKAYDTSIALTSDGHAYAWGYDLYGQIGDMMSYDTTLPMDVSGPGGIVTLNGVTALSRGGTSSFAMTAGGNVMGWGWNTVNPLRDGSLTYVNTPAAVTIP